MVVQAIKRMFTNYMNQVITGMLDDPRDFFARGLESTTHGDKGIDTDITLWDIYDSVDKHYGMVALEVKYDSQRHVTDVITWAQVYGVPEALRFDDLEACIYDMIARRDAFSGR